MVEGTPFLLFDGDCGFCTSSAAWVQRGLRPPARVIPWQDLGADGLARLGLTVEDAQAAAWWVQGPGDLARGHRAVGRSLQASRGWRRAVGGLVLAPGITEVAAPVYRLVARHRHRLPGSTAACRPAASRGRPAGR